MILTVPEFLDARALAAVHDLYEQHQPRAGESTAGGAAGAVKHNVEIDLGERVDTLKQIVLEACNRAPLLNYSLLPRWVSTPLLSLYEAGMAYGSHVDSAVGEDRGRVYRSDLSCTVFLEPPERYAGGELSIDSGETPQTFKLPAGHAVFYPTHHVHEVRPVTGGVRKACVFWMESLVRDAGKRELLAELAQLCEWIREVEPADSVHRRRLVKVRENLYRRWLDT